MADISHYIQYRASSLSQHQAEEVVCIVGLDSGPGWAGVGRWMRCGGWRRSKLPEPDVEVYLVD